MASDGESVWVSSFASSTVTRIGSSAASSPAAAAGKVTLNYTVNEHHFLYAFAATGFRPGGLNVPVGIHSSGLPMGMQLTAAWGQEGRLLDAAKHVEQATSREFVDAVPPDYL